MRAGNVVRLVAITLLGTGLVAPLQAQESIGQEAVEWGSFGAVVAASHLIDQNAQRYFFADGDSTMPLAARIGDRLGHKEIYWAGLGTLYFAGAATGRTELSDGALRTAGVLAATGLLTRGIKSVVGRGRPNNPIADGEDFHPLSYDDAWSSFPSGHATTTFAMATALALQVDSRWAAAGAYGVAGMVAWSRLRENEHWLSDVVGGAIIGVELAELVLPALGADDAGERAPGPGIPIQIRIPVR